jgi:alpha-galactosidase
VGNLWRTTDDIEDKWQSMLANLDQNGQHASAASPGAWNDPDMLEVGNGGMTDDEYRAHFSLWAIMAAPLMAGHDVRTMSSATKEILLNREVIAVDQDSLGKQGILVWESSPEHQVWSKPLADGSRAVALLNRSTSPAKITAYLSRVGLRTDSATVRDLWAHADRGRVGRQYVVEVPAHAVVMVKMTPLR